MAFQVKYSLKRFFFDRKEVIDRIGKKKARILSKFGSFVRRNARSKQLRRRKKVSPAGQPPSVHSRDKVATLKNILFGLEPNRNTVVIGPVGLGRSGRAIPGTLEFGGSVRVREKKVGKQWRNIGQRQARPGQPTRVRVANYEPRPFMLPALEQEAPKFPGLWANTIRA